MKPRARARKQAVSRIIRTFREEEEVLGDGHQEQVVVEEEPKAKRKRDPAETSSESLTHAGVRVAKKTRGAFRSFADARTYARTLGLNSREAWREWSSSGERPHDIPGDPYKSGARPHDIPSRPDTTYASSGWTSYGDFLGYAAGSFRSFEDARAYVRTLGLKSRDAWREWISSGARPHDIPSNPHQMYASSGWTSYGDFLRYDVGKQPRKSEYKRVDVLHL